MNWLLRRYLGTHVRILALIAFLLLVQAITNLMLPRLNADIINDGVVTGDVPEIIRLGAIMLAVSVALGIAAITTVYFSARTAMSVGRDLRADLFRRVESLSQGQVLQIGVPSLITRNTNDVQQVQMLVLMGLTVMVLAPVMAIGAVFMAIREQPRLSLLLVAVIPLMLAVISIMVFRAIPLFRSMQVKIDRVNQVLRENLTGIRVIRAFNRTAWEQDRFAQVNDDLTQTALKVTRLFALVFPALMLIMNLSSVAVIWFGGNLVADGEMPIGNLTAFLSYIMQVLFSVMMAVMTLMMVPRASASADRITEVLMMDPEMAVVEAGPGQQEEQHGPGQGAMELRGVHYRYPGAQDPVLEGISLQFAPGTTTAIVGGTGSGKSTLVNLLPRLRDVTAGQVLLDGVDVRDIPQERLWAHFGLVSQRTVLFRGTIASNVRFGQPDASDERVWQALEVAQAADFVRELPGQLQATVDQGGANLSGGQRQRIAIARAAVRRPRIYLLDDSFSALDYATDARLRAALATWAADASVVLVAQRVSSIRNADQIVVLEQGRIVGTGTHQDLLADCATYREIITSQAEMSAS